MKDRNRKEKIIKAEILLRIGAHPRIRVWKQNTGALPNLNGRMVQFSVPGCSDIIGIISPWGRWLAIETKSSVGIQSENQKNFQAMIEGFGGIYILARSIEPVAQTLKTIGIEI